MNDMLNSIIATLNTIVTDIAEIKHELGFIREQMREEDNKIIGMIENTNVDVERLEERLRKIQHNEV